MVENTGSNTVQIPGFHWQDGDIRLIKETSWTMYRQRLKTLQILVEFFFVISILFYLNYAILIMYLFILKILVSQPLVSSLWSQVSRRVMQWTRIAYLKG